MRFLLPAIALVLPLTTPVHAADLLAVFQQAKANDPLIREADATRLANREARPQALAGLLPQIAGSASRTKADSSSTGQRPQEIEQPAGSGNFVVFNFVGSSDSKPETDRWSIDLRQSVFAWENWVALKRANKQVAQAEADYAAAEQDLISRVASRYFDVLAAKDNLQAQEAARDAFARQLEQAEKRFEVGLIAITDVQEAKAARDNAAAQVIAAKRQLSSTEEALREVTGSEYDLLAAPRTDMPLASPDPADENRWVEVSMEQNLGLISSRLAADIARDDVRAAFGGHLPSIDLVASRSNTNQESTVNFASGNSGISTSDSNDKSVSLQLSVPIFSGGAAQSQVRASQYRWIAAKERLERTSRATERQARDAYLGVISEISRVQALRQALESSRTALKATEAGYEVGTRTAVDVLDSRRTLVQAETNYLRSRYDYINNVINLRLAAGTLNEETLAEINSWLSETAPEAPSP
ncbi:MAG: TolC family outer membrane protein [Steroidobacteraceae bacterium]